MDNESIALGGLLEVARLVKTGEISSTEVTRTILERIEGLNPEYKIFNTVSGDLAMEQAQAADAEVATLRPPCSPPPADAVAALG